VCRSTSLRNASCNPKDDKHRLQRMIDNLLNYCSKFIQLTTLDKEAIELNFRSIKIKRKDYLLKEGLVCDFVALQFRSYKTFSHKRWQ